MLLPILFNHQAITTQLQRAVISSSSDSCINQKGNMTEKLDINPQKMSLYQLRDYSVSNAHVLVTHRIKRGRVTFICSSSLIQGKSRPYQYANRRMMSKYYLSANSEIQATCE